MKDRPNIQPNLPRIAFKIRSARGKAARFGHNHPKDILMGAIHQATMMMARRLNHVKSLPQQDSAERALNKLARTFTSQVETLKRYRSKADQTVRVERVEVNEGGQAIVGNVQNRGRGE